MSRLASILEIRNVSVVFQGVEGPVDAVSNACLSLHSGEALGLVGESGSGKSTLALQCLGYLNPRGQLTGGTIVLEGQDLTRLDFKELSEIRGRKISFVPQNPTTALNPSKRIGQLFNDSLRRHMIVRSSSQSAQLAKELLSKVGLSDLDQMLRRFPHELSGGQQQRVCIAIALACSPDVIVLDEPTTGLDVTTQEQIIGLLVQLKRQLNLSMLYVTHDLALLSQIADRVAVMYAGEIVEVAQTEELFTKPLHPYTVGLINSIPQFTSGYRKPGSLPLRGLLRRAELPFGCRFSTRCDFATKDCKANPQQLKEVRKDHTVACERWDKVDVSHTEIESFRPTLSHQEEEILKVENLTVTYGSPRFRGMQFFHGSTKPAITDVSFSINKGQIFALVGESGSGKSTIAKSVSGILPRDTGQISFCDQLLPISVNSRQQDLRREIQYVFQNPDGSLNPRMKVGDIIGRQIEVLDSCAKRDVRMRVETALDEVRLDKNYIDRYPDELSGGERQRVAIARALAVNPRLLLCDEILSGLDVSVQASVIDLLRQLVSAKQVSMLFISHDVAVVRDLADHIGVLYNGCLLETGNNREVFSAPFHPYTDMLLRAVPQIDKVPKYASSVRSSGSYISAADACVFQDRCDKRIAGTCDKKPPPLRNFGDTISIRCHLEYEELNALD